MLASSLCGHKSSTAPGRQHNIQPWSPNSQTWVLRVLATINGGHGSTLRFFSSHVGSKTHTFLKRHLQYDDDKRWKRELGCDENIAMKSWQILMRLPFVAYSAHI